MRVAIAITLLLTAPLLAQTQWAEAKGARVPVPPGWTFNDRLAASNGPINLTNFGGTYLRGGLIPAEGAEIEITSVPAPSNLGDFVRKELLSANPDKLQEATLGDKSGIRTSYVQTLSADAAIRTQVVYALHGASLYKFHLSYRTTNRNEAALTTGFEKLIKEAQIK